MIWLIGSKGMLGTELSLLLEKNGVDFIGTDREIDITDSAALVAFAEKQASNKSFTWIVNCAAYTAVDNAEDNSEICRCLNIKGAANIAACAKSTGAQFIHLSTDYVFDGKGIFDNTGNLRPYCENDETNPTGVYGLSKRDGELAVLENNSCSYIIRSAWLYGKHGNNFVQTMLRLMNERGEVKVVNDQRGSPTWAGDLSRLIADIIVSGSQCRNFPYGIYHYTNMGSITWFDFAKEIYRQGKEQGLITKNCTVTPCASAEYPSKVKRPAWSVLDKTKIQTVLGIDIPAWDESLKIYLRLLTAENGCF